MAQISPNSKNFPANQCLSHTFYRPWKVGHSSCQNAIMKAADVAHTSQAIQMTALYRWVAMVFIFSVCPHHVHACMQKTMRAARQMQSEQVSISGRIKGVYRHQSGASLRFHVQKVLRARPQRRSKRAWQQQAGSGLAKLACELLHLHSLKNDLRARPQHAWTVSRPVYS